MNIFQHLRRPTYWLLVLCSLAYLGSRFWPGNFQFTDEILFKSAGKEWALHGRFAAPDIVGQLNFDPPITKIYGAYFPLYPELYGLWTRVVGFGWTQAAVFDGLIHLALCWITWQLILNLTQTRRLWLADLLAIAMLPAGVLGRPDELAMSFALLATLVTVRGSLRHWAIVAGACWGLCLASSVSAFGGIGIAQLAWLWFALQKTPPRMRWSHLALLAIMVMVVQCVVWGPILWVDPRAIHQMVQHAANSTNAHTLLNDFAWYWRYVKGAMAPTAAVFVTALVVISLVIARREWEISAHIACFLVAACLLGTSHNAIYLWMVFPIGIAAIWRGIEAIKGKRHLILSFVAGVLVFVGLAISSAVRIVDTIALARIPHDQSMKVNQQILLRLIPPGSDVLLSEHWYSLAPTCRTVDSGFCGMKDLMRADFVVFTGNGSAVPGQRRKLSPILEPALLANFDLIFSDLPTGVPRLFGHGLTNSSRGFGVAVYRRRSGNHSAPAAGNLFTPQPETSLPAIHSLIAS